MAWVIWPDISSETLSALCSTVFNETTIVIPSTKEKLAKETAMEEIKINLRRDPGLTGRGMS
jgi:hypothetical protein